MTALTFFFVFIPALAGILLTITLVLAPHEPYKEKETPFECGYHSFIQTRVEANVIHFAIGLLFLIFDLEVVLIFPFSQSTEYNAIYGLITVVLFIVVLTLGFIFEIGKKALKFVTRIITSIGKNMPKLDNLGLNNLEVTTLKSNKLESNLLPKGNSLIAYFVTLLSIGFIFYVFNMTLALNMAFLIGIVSLIVAKIITSFLDSKKINWNIIFITVALFTFMYIIKLTLFDVGTYIYQDIFEDGMHQSDKYTIPTFTTISYFFSDLLAEKYLYMGSDNNLSDSSNCKSKPNSHILYAISGDGNNSNSGNRTQSGNDNSRDVSNEETNEEIIEEVFEKAVVISSYMDDLFTHIHEGIDISEQNTTDESSLGVNYSRENYSTIADNIIKAHRDKEISHIGDAIETTREFCVESKSLIETLEDKKSDMSPSDEKDKLKDKITECQKDLKTLEKTVDYVEKEYNSAVEKIDKND